MNYNKLFFELVQISIGARDSFSVKPSEKEWGILHDMAMKQALVGVLFTGVEKVGKEAGIPKDTLLQWFARTNQLKSYNDLLDARAQELNNMLKSDGMRSCLLKGQGTALLYPRPERRQCGDIDLWLEGQREDVLGYLQGRAKVEHISIKHCDWKVFDDVEVEIHFIPSWFYNPIHHRRFVKWLESEQNEQFSNSSTKDFNVPTIGFNLVYSMVHIYRHLFDEGIGLRQLMDYYYILQNSKDQDRQQALVILGKLGMSRFVGAVMYVMKIVFLLEDNSLLSKPADEDGALLLQEIMLAGNFGKYDQRVSHNKDTNKVFVNGFRNLKKNMRFLKAYHSEVLWATPWKLWHYGWRKWHGYL